jgi:hypothetical protein
MFLWLVRVVFLVCFIGWSWSWVHAMFVRLVVEVDFVLEMTGCRGIDRGLPVFHAFG